jgi:type VI secretion system protein
MSLVLQVESADPTQAATAKQRIEVADRLTIGRAPKNDLVLKGSEHVSNFHCVIQSGGQGYTVTDMSRNGTFLNFSTERLPRETAVPLPEGSVLLLGSYTLTVTAITPAQSPSPGLSVVARPAASRGKSEPAPDDELFGDPLLNEAVVKDDRLVNGPKGQVRREADRTTDDVGSPLPQTPFIPDDLFGEGQDLPPAGGSDSDHASDGHTFYDPPKPVRNKIPDDWDLSELNLPIDKGLLKPVDPSDPTPAAGQKPKPSAPPVLRMPARETDDGAALASFLAAAGLAAVPLTGAEKVRIMRDSGQMLVATISGLIALLSARKTMKEEFRIDRTNISPKSNNPLKFQTSAADAMRQLLIDRPPGFLPGPQSIEEALDDLKRHQVALMAGMQATLATVVARFDPATLEKRLEQSSILEDLLPAARKARYWEVFKTCYKEIVNELQDDFHKDLGEKFARAYLEQVERS